MTLQYLFGGAGAGKTRLCIEEMTRLAKGGGTLIYIAPEQFTLESEKSLCAAAKGRAVVSPQVLSFGRLAYRLFAENGVGGGKLLDDAGSNMLLRKITLELTNELPFFGKSIDKPGFIDNLQLMIREFYQYDIGVERLERLTAQMMPHEGLYQKMRDLHRIYTRYVAYMHEKYISTDQALDLAPEKAIDSEFLADSLVWIDGFNGFTPQEYKIIDALFKKAKRVTIALTVKSSRITYDGLNGIDPFFEMKTTVNKLTTLARQNNVNVKEPLLLKDSPRFHDAPALAFLEKHYLDYHKHAYDKPVTEIEIISAGNQYEEITAAAKRILKMVREDGLRFNQIALAKTADADYEKAIRSVWGTYSIPFFIDKKRDIFSHPLTVLIRSAVDIVAYNWSYEPVFSFLKTSLTGLTLDDVDILENYALAYGIKGEKWRMDEWRYGFSDGHGTFDRKTIHACKTRVCAAIAPFADEKNRTKKYTVKTLAVDIFEMLARLHVPEKLDVWAETAASTGNQDIARQHSQIWNKVCALFDKMVEILGDEYVTIKVFSKILEAGFKATDMGLIPPSQEQVLISDLERSRLPDIKALILVGVNEGVLPGIKKEIGLLGDDERMLLRGAGAELAPDSRRRSYEEQFLIYAGILKPSGSLILSYSKGTLAGKAMRPSALIGKIKRLFPQLVEQAAEDMAGDITLPKPMFSQLGNAIRAFASGEGMSDTQKDVYRWFGQQPTYQSKLAAIEKICFEQRQKAFLNDASVALLYGKEIITGVSRLEQYVKCPFAYYILYDLEAQDRKLYETSALDYGNFFHMVLETFSETLHAQNERWRDLGEEKISDMVDVCMEALAPTLSNEVILSTARFRHMLARVGRICKKSIWALSRHVQHGLFEPKGWEVAFGNDGPLTSIAVAINDKQKFLLTGRIDRVDIADINGNTYVKIIDYKSGNVRFDMDDLYFGMQLQLMTYLDAFIKNGAAYFGAEQLEGSVLPGGVFYFNVNDPVLSLDEVVIPEKLEDMMLKSFKMTGLALADALVINGMDEGLDGHSSVIPVQWTKNGLGRRSSVATLERFGELRGFAMDKIAEIGREMCRGNISAYPYKKEKDNTTACDYCGFKAICHIDTFETGAKYHIVPACSGASRNNSL